MQRRKVEDLAGSREQTEPSMKKVKDIIGEDLIQALIDSFNKIRALQDRALDVVGCDPFATIDSILEKVEGLRKGGWYSEKTARTISTEVMKEIIQGPELALAAQLKNDVGEHRDFGLDFLILKVVSALKEAKASAPGTLTRDFLNNLEIYPLDRDSKWSNKQIMKRYDNINSAKTLYIAGLVNGEITEEVWPNNFWRTIFSANPGYMSAVERKAQEIVNKRRSLVKEGVTLSKKAAH